MSTYTTNTYSTDAPADKAKVGANLIGEAVADKTSDLAARMDDLSLKRDVPITSSWENKTYESKWGPNQVQPSEGADMQQRGFEAGLRAGNAVIQKKDDIKYGVQDTVAQAQDKAYQLGQTVADKADSAKQSVKSTAADLEQSGEQSRLSTQDQIALSAAGAADSVSAKFQNLRPDETSTQDKSLPAKAMDMAIGTASAVAGAAKAAAVTVVNAFSAPEDKSATATDAYVAPTSSSDLQDRAEYKTQQKFDNAGVAISDAADKAKFKADDLSIKAAETTDQAKGVVGQIGQAIVNTVSSIEHSLEARGEHARLGTQDKLAAAGDNVAREQGETSLTLKAKEARPDEVQHKSMPVRAADAVLGAGCMVMDAAKAAGGAVAGVVHRVSASTTSPVSEPAATSSTFSDSTSQPLAYSSATGSIAGDADRDRTVVVEKESITRTLPPSTL
jgi:hypothetical protein